MKGGYIGTIWASFIGVTKGESRNLDCRSYGSSGILVSVYAGCPVGKNPKP